MEVEAPSTDHMPLSTARSAVVVAILEQLRARDIPIAVLNGVSGPIPLVGRDVDLLIFRNDLSTVANLARTVAEAQGWNHATGRWLGSWYRRGLYQLVFHRIAGGRVFNIAFDLICSNGIAAGVIPAYSPQLLHGIDLRDSVPTTMVGAYMKSAFTKALAGIEDGFLKVERARPLAADVRRHIAGLLGDRFLRTYEDYISQGRVREEWRHLRRRAQRAYAVRRPILAFRNGMVSLIRRTVGSRMHHVHSIAIVGPDGVGKSAAIEHARRALRDAFLDVRCREWTTPTRIKTTRLATMRILYQQLKYGARNWFRDRRSTRSEIPINVYEGCALDMAVAPERYGQPPRMLSLWLSRSCHKVDRIIALRDRADHIMSRGSSLSTAEIQQQMDRWTALCRERRVAQIIDVENQTAEAVGIEIARAILEAVLPPARLGRPTSKSDRAADVAARNRTLQAR